MNLNARIIRFQKFLTEFQIWAEDVPWGECLFCIQRRYDGKEHMESLTQVLVENGIDLMKFQEEHYHSCHSQDFRAFEVKEGKLHFSNGCVWGFSHLIGAVAKHMLDK